MSDDNEDPNAESESYQRAGRNYDRWLLRKPSRRLPALATIRSAEPKRSSEEGSGVGAATRS